MTWLKEKCSTMTSVSAETIVWLLDLVRLFLYPSFYVLNRLLSLYMPTIEETRKGGMSITTKLILTLIYTALFILTLPIAIVFFPIRCFLLTVRDPFVLSVKYTPYTSKITLDRAKSKQNQFSIATGNLCLLPECLARINHLRDVDKRSRKMGERIVADQFFANNSAKQRKSSVDDTVNKNDSGNGNVDRISTKFNSIDFFMIQEAWSSYHTKTLMEELHKVYPFIVYDAGFHSFSRNKFAFNGGVMIASRYPIIAIDFKPFMNYCRHGVVMSQGLLMAKVDLGLGLEDERRVGYLFNAHFQAYQGALVIIPKEMDETVQYIDDFMKQTWGPKDKILFNFLCGDFNCDNMSPGDKESRSHRLFELYEDYGREKLGVDKEWTLGTELRQRYMFEPMVLTPEGLKMAMEDPCHRRRHFNDAIIEEHNLASLAESEPPCDSFGNVLAIPEGGRRRIDHIVYHKDQPVKVDSYSFVTRLTTLTDHIPVQMEFTCLDQDEK